MSWADDEGYDYDDSREVLEIIETIHETEKAYLFRDKVGCFWISKALIEDSEGNEIYVPHWFKPKYLERDAK